MLDDTGGYRCLAALINTGGLWRRKKKPGNLAIFFISLNWTTAGRRISDTGREHTAREIEQKARKAMGMLKRGIKFTPTQPDVMAILEKLREPR